MVLEVQEHRVGVGNEAHIESGLHRSLGGETLE